MSNQEISEMFTAIYNQFWIKWRNHQPKLHDGQAWIQMMDEVLELHRKYGEPVKAILSLLMNELDRRAREDEYRK